MAAARAVTQHAVHTLPCPARTGCLTGPWAAPPRAACAVYEAGRTGATVQEQWWQSGGASSASLLGPARSLGAAGKRKRFAAEEANKENQQQE